MVLFHFYGVVRSAGIIVDSNATQDVAMELMKYHDNYYCTGRTYGTVTVRVYGLRRRARARVLHIGKPPHTGQNKAVAKVVYFRNFSKALSCWRLCLSIDHLSLPFLSPYLVFETERGV